MSTTPEQDHFAAFRGAVLAMDLEHRAALRPHGPVAHEVLRLYRAEQSDLYSTAARRAYVNSADLNNDAVRRAEGLGVESPPEPLDVHATLKYAPWLRANSASLLSTELPLLAQVIAQLERRRTLPPLTPRELLTTYLPHSILINALTQPVAGEQAKTRYPLAAFVGAGAVAGLVAQYPTLRPQLVSSSLVEARNSHDLGKVHALMEQRRAAQSRARSKAANAAAEAA